MTFVFAGIDIGSTTTKAVIVDAKGDLKGKAIVSSGMDFAQAGRAVFEQALTMAGVKETAVGAIVGSGYGRRNIAFANAVKTEIACHSRGAFHHFKEKMTIIDIGGQDNKIIKVDANGNRVDFKMNRKCAAGTGAFLDEIARRMNVGIEEMEGLARQSTEFVEIGSFCTVFSATEILSLVRKGVKTTDIAKGAFRSVCKRVTEMDPLAGTVVATGGVIAHNPIVVELLAETIGHPVATPPNPQFTGALGAALYAIDEKNKEQ